MRKPKPPEKHPAAWQSPLWEHLDLIRSMRRARKGWKVIADHLKAAHGISVNYRTVIRFYARATNPKKGKLPLGFNHLGATKAAPHPDPTPDQRESAPPAKQTPEGLAAATEAARARIKARLQQQPEEPAWDLKYDPDKPLKP